MTGSASRVGYMWLVPEDCVLYEKICGGLRILTICT